MPNGPNPRVGGVSPLVLIFISVVATVFVAEQCDAAAAPFAERLLRLTREVTVLQRQLESATQERNSVRLALQEAGIMDLNALRNRLDACRKPPLEEPQTLEVPFIDVQPAQLEDLPFDQDALRLDAENVQTVLADETDSRMPSILGQVDLIEDGYVQGWACEKGNPETPIEVKLFVNEIKVGSVFTRRNAQHPLVDRICAGPGDIGLQDRNVAFKFRLPDLKEGMYHLRAFVYSADGLWRKELNSSPQRFVESTSQPGLSDAVKRKDAIIRARNAQVAALYEQLHTRGNWQKVVQTELVRNFTAVKADNKYLAFVGLISNPNDIHSRDLQRKSWFPRGQELQITAEEKGVLIRFVIGKSDWMTESEMRAIREEQEKHSDILVVDMRGFEDPAKKTLAFFSAVAFKYDVDFVFKGEKDTMVDVDALVAYLKPLREKGNLYLGCMKSGEVIRSARQKWHEPEHWKFGDAQGTDRKANYPRHAHRQLLGVSGLVARYLTQNAHVMHFYANDDVSVGVWLLGLDVEYIHESRFCCQPRNCLKVGSAMDERCIGYFEPACPGVCKPDVSIASTYNTCMQRA